MQIVAECLNVMHAVQIKIAVHWRPGFWIRSLLPVCVAIQMKVLLHGLFIVVKPLIIMQHDAARYCVSFPPVSKPNVMHFRSLRVSCMSHSRISGAQTVIAVHWNAGF